MMKSRGKRWTGYVARMEARRNAYAILVRKPDGKRPLVRPRRWWVVNINMDLGEIEWGGMRQWRALVNTVINLRFP
jgi:hypothetical protein